MDVCERRVGKIVGSPGEKPLDCIICSREFRLDEVFIFFVRDNDPEKVVVSMCLDHPEFDNDKPEKDGHWFVGRRTLDGYDIVVREMSPAQ